MLPQVSIRSAALDSVYADVFYRKTKEHHFVFAFANVKKSTSSYHSWLVPNVAAEYKSTNSDNKQKINSNPLLNPTHHHLQVRRFLRHSHSLSPSIFRFFQHKFSYINVHHLVHLSMCVCVYIKLGNSFLYSKRVLFAIYSFAKSHIRRRPLSTGKLPLVGNTQLSSGGVL